MGELEHFPLVDTQHLCPGTETERRAEKKKRKSVFSTPVFVFVTQIDFCYLAQLQTLGTSV